MWRPKDRLVESHGRARLTSGRIAFLASFLVALSAGTQSFVGDAGFYWAQATKLARFSDPYSDSSAFVTFVSSTHGMLTAWMYVPAALVSRVLGGRGAGACVLVENAILIAVIAAVLMPRLVAIWRPVGARTEYLVAALGTVILRGFAPYPLSDVWATFLVLCGVLVVSRAGRASGTSRTLLLGGALFAAAFNVRPAYTLVLVGAVVVVLSFRKLEGLWFAAGAALALVPQSVVNLTHGGGPTPLPSELSGLQTVQATYAVYTVRYDTWLRGFGDGRRQFFCDQRWSRALGTTQVQSTTDVALEYIHHPLLGVRFTAEKFAASLHWSTWTPFYGKSSLLDSVFAGVVTIVAVAGCVGLLVSRRRGAGLAKALMITVVAGTAASIALSAPEARFAVPVVVIGIVGLTLLFGHRRFPVLTVLVASIACAAVFSAGVVGLAHPAPRGEATQATCTGLAAPTLRSVAPAGPGKVTVSFARPTSSGGSNLVAYVVTPYVGLVRQRAVVIRSMTTTQTIHGLPPGVYRFRIAAANEVGIGPSSRFSEPVTVAGGGTPPGR